MKKLLGLFFICLCSFTGSAYTASIYTFSGEILSAGFSDGTGAIQNAGLGIGSTISYSFLIDTSRQATRRLNNGTILTDIDTSNAVETIDFFHTDLISGGLGEVNGGQKNNPTDVAEYNHGVSAESAFYTDFVSLIGGPEDNRVSIRYDGLSLTDWVVGTTSINGREFIYSPTSSSFFQSNLTLQSINPVPIPAAVWLFGSALLGFITYSARRSV
ncbi:MAG: hypothetical protein AB2728_10885 [Candidatus Thiodiazotropha sp.]|nr:hypothetical protein [Candidatus Thiodiazotropha taylori]MBT3059566.1 hypothetical protein [Candidatus Thiodiazotropha sp. (ex Lucina pensylvanica)]